LDCSTEQKQESNGFALMQCIKESSTLRLGSKGDKPFPRIVFSVWEKKTVK